MHYNQTMKKVWFKAKNYGWGWYPATWQGWLVILLYLVAIVVGFSWDDNGSHSGSDTLLKFVPRMIVLTAILIAVSYAKGEPPRWRWGK